jgi:ketosteroid isomerase-like protein
MDLKQFTALLDTMTLAAEAADGERFARCFTEDATYHDYIYGPHTGRADIAHMLTGLFRRDADVDYRWEFFDPVLNGDLGYAWSLSSFTSLVPAFKGKFVVIDGMSQFTLREGLIACYRESVNGGVAMAQLGVEPARMAKVMNRWSGWLQERAETRAFLAKGKWRQK